jgi:hypothetical protein
MEKGTGAEGHVSSQEGSRSGRVISLHPVSLKCRDRSGRTSPDPPCFWQLAIVTISDHCTRVKVGGSRQHPDSRILGLLFGYQDGLEVSITDATELQVGGPSWACRRTSLAQTGDLIRGCLGLFQYEEEGGEIRFRQEYIDEKKALYSAVYPRSEVMGW